MDVVIEVGSSVLRRGGDGGREGNMDAAPPRRSLEFYAVLVKSCLTRQNQRFGGLNF